jgi:hypothetical protein
MNVGVLQSLSYKVAEETRDDMRRLGSIGRLRASRDSSGGSSDRVRKQGQRVLQKSEVWQECGEGREGGEAAESRVKTGRVGMEQKKSVDGD